MYDCALSFHSYSESCPVLVWGYYPVVRTYCREFLLCRVICHYSLHRKQRSSTSRVIKPHYRGNGTIPDLCRTGSLDAQARLIPELKEVSDTQDSVLGDVIARRFILTIHLMRPDGLTTITNLGLTNRWTRCPLGHLVQMCECT